MEHVARSNTFAARALHESVESTLSCMTEIATLSDFFNFISGNKVYFLIFDLI